MAKLGELERAVMEVLWERSEPAGGRDVARALSERDLAYTTVMTVLNRLATKGFVRRERDGQAWRFTPSASREDYIARLMLDALALAGDRDAALTHFAHSVSRPDAEILSKALGKKHKR